MEATISQVQETPKSMDIYTPQMFAKHFNVTFLKPYNIELQNSVKIQGRKKYKDAEAVSISVTENRKNGVSVVIHVIVNGHFRKVNWNSLSDTEKVKIQNNLNLQLW